MTEQERNDFIVEQLSRGASLSEVQNALAAHGVRMTYMDLRFLADDLKVNWTRLDKPKPAPAPAPEPAEAEVPGDNGEALDEQEPAEFLDATADEPTEDGGDGSQTRLTLDPTPAPGSMMSGSVTFASGLKGKWFLDRFGRPGFEPDDENDMRQPTDEDLEQFQTRLQAMMQARNDDLRKRAHDGRTVVDISPITKPGCRMNGTVTFASGAKGEWLLGERGVDFDLDDPNLKPTQDDMAFFQILLTEKLREKGYGM